MKVLKHIDTLNSEFVGVVYPCTSFHQLSQLKAESLTDEMMYFSINAIDNSWYMPIGWFPKNESMDSTEFVINRFQEILKIIDTSVNVVCGCADGEIDTKAVQQAIQATHKDFVFLNDYVHNFKNQRNASPASRFFILLQSQCST